MKLNFILVVFVLLCTICSCKKSAPKTLSDAKNITSFKLLVADNPSLPADISGIIQQDSIVLTLPPAIPLNNLVPSITISGVSVSPASKAAQDLSTTVNYTVVAEDGTKRFYKVIARNAVAPKDILQFSFKLADNPNIYGDIDAVVGADSIWIEVPVSTDITALKASITISGNSVAPGSGMSVNYTSPVSYTVTGVDNTTKKYTVVVKKKAMAFITTTFGYICGVDAITGKTYWQKFIGGGLKGATFSNDMVYTCDGANVYGVDAANGNVKWHNSNISGIITQPSASDNSVFVTYLGYQYTLNLYGFVAAIDAVTGNLQWQTRVSSPSFTGNDLFISSPVYYNGKVYLNDWGQGTFCVDALSGNILWQNGENLQTVTPLLYNGNLYTGGEGSISNIAAADGTVNWKIFSAGNTTSTPAVSNEVVYIGGYLRSNAIPSGPKLMAFNKNDGTLLWAIDPILNHEGVFMSVTSYGDNIFTVAGGRLLSYKKSDGSLNWYNEIGVNTNPLAFNGLVYVAANDRFLVVNATTGATQWTFLQFGDSFTANPCIVDTAKKLYQCGIQ